MNSFSETYGPLMERDLNALIKEIELYDPEENLWKVWGDVSNSGGNLALHLIGNLRHFIGHIIGKTNYVREREKEFSVKNKARKEILEEIEITKKEVIKGLEEMDEVTLKSVYPINVLGYEMSTEHFLLHLYAHLNYHLGQINYHRRLSR